MTMRRKKKKRKGIIGFLREFWRQFTRYMLTGLLVWIPLMVTIWVSWFFINKFVIGLDSNIQGLVRWINEQGENYPALGFLRKLTVYKGAGILIAIAIFLITGFLTRSIVGRRVIAIGERIVDAIPFISRIYRAVQQIRDTFIHREGSIFQKVCMIEYPRAGVFAMAFITSRERSVIQASCGEDLIAVFLPTTPNPTSGFLLYVSKEQVTELDISVEDGMKLIISGGAYIPGKQLHGHDSYMDKNEDEEEMDDGGQESGRGSGTT